MIASVTTNDLEILISERIVAGNLPLSHRKVRFEKFRSLCSGQQFVRWNGATPDSGGGAVVNSFTRSFFEVPIQRCSGYMKGIADVGNTGVRVLQKPPGHADFPGIHFRRPPATSSPCPRGSKPALSPLTDEFPLKFRQEHRIHGRSVCLRWLSCPCSPAGSEIRLCGRRAHLRSR
jgi:hypothetical protein